MKSSKSTVKAITQTINKADSLASLKMKLKTTDPEIQNYVAALEAENLKLQRQIAKLQVQNVSINNRITILEENLKEKPNLMATVVEALRKIEHNEPPEK